MNIIGLSRGELEQAILDLGMPRYRANQMWIWLYHHGVTTFDRMTNIGAADRAKLAAHFVIERPAITQVQASVDGTQKWLLRFTDGNEAEVVHIPEETRGTLCISSQIGCTLTCSFCHTGTQMLVRNLTAQEIVNQIMIARDAFGEWPSPVGSRHVSNIVMMGMGEPLYNYDNVAKALTIIMDHQGVSLSRRRITLSTSGVVPMIRRCGEELGVNLAISLHAVRDDLRNILVPLNKKYPLAELLQACREYPSLCNTRRITFEYVMLKGVNDTDADARELARLIRGIPAKINIIPFNPWPGSPYERSTHQRIQAFGDIINRAGYASPVRTPRGDDILAACGQLKSQSERQRKYARRPEQEC
jgi:23S rRNA (adenine2503-C2)-methyltransferase